MSALQGTEITLPEFRILPQFTMKDFTHSSVLNRYNSDPTNRIKISNVIPEKYLQRAQETIDLLNDLQDAWGSKLILSSGYRSRDLNTALKRYGHKPSAKSLHMSGAAMDFYPEDPNVNMVEFQNFVKNYLDEHGIGFDQLLYEYDKAGKKWIHLGLYNNLGNQRRQVRIYNPDAK